MASIITYTLASVFLVSLVSFVGILTLSVNVSKLKNILVYMISFSAGALLGDVFIHLLPEVIERKGFTLQVSLWVLGGIVLSLIVEKVIHWRHCHTPTSKEHPHPYAIMNLFGDGIHNLLDGLIIGASYLISISVGIATTIAVVFHEIPQEIGDIGVLLHGGFSKIKALFVNFLTALMAVLGASISLVIGSRVESLTPVIIPLAAGGFIYIAGSDLIPELHKEVGVGRSLLQVVFFALGVFVMVLLLGLET